MYNINICDTPQVIKTLNGRLKYNQGQKTFLRHVNMYPLDSISIYKKETGASETKIVHAYYPVGE